VNRQKKHFFDNPKNVRIVFYGFCVSLLLLLAAEPFIHKHPFFTWDGWFGFYPLYGIVSCLLLVVAAKFILRPFLKRKEDHYD
jgi:hypothetical protein